MKSERAVNNPENHGWEPLGDGRYIWASGRNTGHITDGDTEGQIATWHDPSNAWTPQSAVIVDGAGVTFGSSCNLPKDAALQFQKKGGGVDNALYYSDDLWVGRDAPNIKFRTNGDFNPRLTIDSSGNVGIGMAPLRSTAKEQLAEWKSQFDARLKAEPKADKKAVTLEITDDAFEVLPTEDKLAEWMETRAAGDKLQVAGNATFSGNALFGNAAAVYGNFGNDMVLGTTACTSIMPITNGQANLGGSTNQWNQLFAVTTRSQRIIQDGSPVIDAKGLIKTLTTLRQATMDETQDIRESLRSAIDELVAGFEQEIATMPAPEEDQDG